MDKYDKSLNYSYTFGTFPTFELIKNYPQNAIKVLYHSSLNISKDIEELFFLAKQNNIQVENNDKLVCKLRDKDNIFVIGVFNKYKKSLQNNANHLLLYNPSDTGNVGTIIRTALGFGYNNIAIITPCADIFNPKTIRASMGSIFSSNIELFESFADYQQKYLNRQYFPFMLKATKHLQNLSKSEFTTQNHTLIFGNESSGLEDKFLDIGSPIKIEHSNKIDSLNLCNSVSIALYEFEKITNNIQ